MSAAGSNSSVISLSVSKLEHPSTNFVLEVSQIAKVFKPAGHSGESRTASFGI